MVVPALPVCRRRPLAARFADLGVEGIGVLVMVLRVDVGVLFAGAVGAAVHGAVQRVDADVRVVLGGPLRRTTYVQDLGVVALPGLAFPQLPGFGLDPDGEDEEGSYTNFPLATDISHYLLMGY